MCVEQMAAGLTCLRMRASAQGLAYRCTDPKGTFAAFGELRATALGRGSLSMVAS